MVNGAAIQQGLNGLVYLQIIALGRAGFLNESIYHPFMRRIASGEHHAGQSHRVSNF
jgi:hypothetical protein